MRISYINRIIRNYLGQKTTAREDDAMEQWFSALEKKATPHDSIKLDRIGQSIWSEIEQAIAPTSYLAKNKTLRIWRSMRGIAALLLLSIGFFFYLADRPIRYSTAAGETRKVELPDGSMVWLAEKSTIRVLSGLEKSIARKVELLDGEAFFEVKKDPSRPFFVQGEHMLTEVVGTSFRITAYKGQSAWCLTVKTGKVRVQDVRDSSKRFTLIANETLRYAQDSKSFELYKNNKTEPANLVFQDNNLAEIARRLERRYAIRIHLAAGLEGEHRFSGEFKPSESMYDVLDMICIAIGTQYKAVGNEITIESNTQ